MKKYSYIIVGGGMTADSSVAGIREVDPEGSVLLISSESDPPYDRPPLSKSLWKNLSVEKIWRHTREKNAEILLNTTVRSIDPELKVVTDDSGRSFQYEKLLLATGGKTRKLPFGGDLVHYYRTLEDFRKLKDISEEKSTFAVIGSGFIGSEIAAALAMNGKEVLLFDMGPGIGWNIFSSDMVEYLNAYYREKNIKIISNVKVNDIKKNGEGITIEISGPETFNVDAVVAGVGISPNVELAESIELKVENGIHVNEYLQTSDKYIFAAGDVANFYNPLLAKRIRVEHSDNANKMGKAAGRNMAGASEPYEYLPLFYSDLFDLGYEAVGLLDSRCEVVEDWQVKFEKGVVYYFEDDRVCGILLWNVWDQVDAARKIIGLPSPINPQDLIGKIN